MDSSMLSTSGQSRTSVFVTETENKTTWQVHEASSLKAGFRRRTIGKFEKTVMKRRKQIS